MAYWNDADIEAMLAGAGGVDVVHAAETGKGIVDEIDEELLQGADAATLSNHKQLTIRTSAFPTLKIDDTITIAGVSHLVTDRKKIEDGGLTHLLVRPG